MCGVINFYNTITMSILCLYFMFVPEWFYIEIIMTSCCVVSWLVVILFMPESAKWCLSKGNMEGALKSYDRIARLNGSKNLIPRDAVFVEFSPAKNSDP